MLFVGWLFPRMKPLAVAYVMWMWFSTMYLTHHYMIDLVGGSIYAILAFVVAQNFLPKVNPDTRTRLGYLGITKSSISSYIYSIEHDSRDYYDTLPITATMEEQPNSVMKEVITHSIVASAMQRHFVHKPEPLRIYNNHNLENEEIESPVLSSSASSSGYWSPTSEPDSPITPHSPLSSQFDFDNNKPC